VVRASVINDDVACVMHSGVQKFRRRRSLRLALSTVDRVQHGHENDDR